MPSQSKKHHQLIKHQHHHQHHLPRYIVPNPGLGCFPVHPKILEYLRGCVTLFRQFHSSITRTRFYSPLVKPPKKYGHVHPPILTVPPVFVHFPSSPNIFQPSTSTFKGCHLMKRGLMLYHSILCPACYEGLESWNVWIGVFVDHGIFDVPQLASSKLVPAFRITMLVQMISVTSKNGFIIHKHRYTYK